MRASVPFASALAFATTLHAELPLPPTRAFFDAHCVECHGAQAQKGGVRLDTLPPDFASFTHAETWLNVMDQLNSGEMPPKKKPRPPQLRRLSRYEYERTAGACCRTRVRTWRGSLCRRLPASICKGRDCGRS